jgi:AcrR family transcriptional regulator
MLTQTPMPEQTDGRRQRSEASREKIVQAMLALVAEGDVCPGAESVAARAGVGLRTVFRHFENMESLYQQISAVVTAELVPMVDEPFTAQDWAGRLIELIERRARIFERVMPYKIAGEVHRHQSAFLERQATELVREQRATLVQLLPEAKRADAGFLDGLDLLLSFESWRRLRKDQKLSPAAARQVLERLVSALLQ